MFVDEASFYVAAGDGGDGMVAFRREKFVPRGGPSGGDGGRGGDIVFVASTSVNTLADFRHRRHLRASHGSHGGPNQRTGSDGEGMVIPVPVGTLVFDDETGEQLADMTHEGDRFVVARGGDGGMGNQNFATSRNQAPRKATPGFSGEQRMIRLELKLLADVGLVGYPSVGKSTLIAAVSNARPKIAAYPFTTLVPNLGVVTWREGREFVIADIPGIIEGAHEGLGLGIQFLKHIERTSLLVHLLEVTPQLEGEEDGRDPIHDYEVLCEELKQFNPELLERPQLVVLNKIDLPEVKARESQVRAHFEALQLPFLAISAAGHIGLDELVAYLGEVTLTQRVEESRGDQLEWWERDEAPPIRANTEEE